MKKTEEIMILQPIGEAHERTLVGTNSSRIKKAHESSNLDKEITSIEPGGVLKNELQIILTKPNVKVSKKVSYKKGK